MRKPRTYSGLENALELTAATYRRSLWDTQSCYVEVWCEKDTLAGVLTIETEPYDVPLMVVRGFASETYLYQAAQTIRQAGKPAHLYVLTDLDPSGLSIAQTIETRIRGFAPDAEVTVQRIAVTPEQVPLWNLPTPVSYTHLRAHETVLDLVCRLLLE